MISTTTVDWRRVAQPQADGYDTTVLLSGAANNPLSTFRRARGPAIFQNSHSIFDGAVRICHLFPRSPYDNLHNAPVDHPNFAAAEGYLSLWPAVYRQFPRIIRFIHPLALDTPPPEGGAPSCSGSREDLYGVIFTTAEHPVTLAEALVHEMAHNKLFALGISIERAARFIINPGQQLYESPVISDRKRPMTAVFHAEYSFIHILQLNLLMYQHEADPDLRSLILQLLTETTSRMERGWEEIRRHIRTDREGALFVGGFLDWASEVISAARNLITLNT